jgi:integrase
VTKTEREHARKHLYKQPGSANWFVRLYVHGKQVRETTGTADETEACRIAFARLDEAGADRTGAKRFIGPEQKKITVQQLLDALRVDYKLREKGTGSRLDANLKPVEEWFGHYKALELTSADVDKFIEHALLHGRRKDSSKGARPASINRSLQLLNQAFKLGKKQLHLNSDLYIRRLSEVGNARQGFFSSMEFRSVLANLSEHWRDYVEFFYLCGMRPKEIRSLSWADVDTDCIRLRAENAKTGHSRSIPLTGQIADLITRRRLQMSAKTNLIFHYKGQPIGDHRKAWKTACRLAGCPGKLLYDLRRTFCRDGIRAGVPQSVVMSISGHRTVSTFLRYNITNDADQRAALEARENYSAQQLVIKDGEQDAEPKAVTERVQ